MESGYGAGGGSGEPRPTRALRSTTGAGGPGSSGGAEQPVLALPRAHLLHAAPGHSGEGVGHQPGAQASEQPYLPVHLHDVLGCGRADGAASRPAPAHPLLGHIHTQTRHGLVPRYLPDSVTGGSTGHNPGSTWAPLPNAFSSPFPFAKPSKHIHFLTNRIMFLFFLAVKNLLGKLSDGFSIQQLQCYNQGTSSAADEKCFPLEKKGKRLPPGNNEVCNLREGKGKGKGRAPGRKAREGPLGTSRRGACPLCHCAAPRTPTGTSWHLFITGVGGAGGENQLRRN